jgi:transcriptional regulator with XRE-family HTH domain
LAKGPLALLVERHRLASDLRELRRRSGLSSTAIAQRIGVSQPKVSRVENAKAVVSVSEAEAWARACGASAEETVRLAELAGRALAEVVNYRSAIREGLPPVQREIAALEHLATTIRVYTPLIVPGLLQTAAYAQRLYEIGGYPASEIPSAVAARVERQSVLYDRSHRFEFLIAEPALRWRLAPPDVYLAQIDRIATVVTLPNVEIGILPEGEELPALRWHDFVLFEDRSDGGDPMALVETVTAVVNVSEPEDLERYRQAFSQLWAGATRGRAALPFLARLRPLPQSHDGEDDEQPEYDQNRQ